MPRCVDCGTETPREEMYGALDELRCRACVQRRFPTTNVATPHRSTVFRRWPPVTLAVIVTAVFVTLLYASGARAVGWLIADHEPVWEGELWRLLTSVFVHDRSSPLHVAFNALWMWRLGKGLETWMGSLRFAAFFVAAAVGSSAAQLLTDVPGIGLSGVVYALVGILFVLREEEQFAADLMPSGLVQFFVVWFFICIALTYYHWYPVANVAHGAGAVIGWLFGRAILARRRIFALLGVSLTCGALALATLYMPWNGYYDFHRGLACFDRKDYTGAVKWFDLAAKRLTGENQERARHNAELARDILELDKDNDD
jgi:membrane associated rhomboid family serine protease